MNVSFKYYEGEWTIEPHSNSKTVWQRKLVLWYLFVSYFFSYSLAVKNYTIKVDKWDDRDSNFNSLHIEWNVLINRAKLTRLLWKEKVVSTISTSTLKWDDRDSNLTFRIYNVISLPIKLSSQDYYEKKKLRVL
jgi:hypothetical protein